MQCSIMLDKLVTDLASKMRIGLSATTIVEGPSIGVLDANLLHLSKDGNTVSTIIYKVDLDNLVSGIQKERLLDSVQWALTQLKRATRQSKKRA